VIISLGIGVSSKLVSRVGVRGLPGVGFGFCAAGILLLAAISVHGSYATQVLPGMVLMAFGSGLCFAGFSNASVHRVTSEDASLASGVQNAVQQVGGAIGLAVLATLAFRHAASGVRHGTSAAAASTAGTVLAFRIGAVVMAVGAAAVWAILAGVRADATGDITADLPAAA
jgi:hypothetical protein